MNQVMINAVELQLLQDELKHLRKENLNLKEMLANERDFVKLLKAEVAWAERGYTRKGESS
jgi:predicted nuclease with TOPRIM domain